MAMNNIDPLTLLPNTVEDIQLRVAIASMRASFETQLLPYSDETERTFQAPLVSALVDKLPHTAAADLRVAMRLPQELYVHSLPQLWEHIDAAGWRQRLVTITQRNRPVIRNRAVLLGAWRESRCAMRTLAVGWPGLAQQRGPAQGARLRHRQAWGASA